MRRRLAYVIPTIYLVVVFTAFQAVSISTTRVDVDNPAPPVPFYTFVLTLPWSLLSSYFKGSLVYLPMVVGTPLNAALLYFLLGGWRKK